MTRLSLAIILFICLKSYLGQMRPKIVGGLDASIEDWPFIAFINFYTWKDKLVSACGGSLISTQTILTAAHCLDDTTSNKKIFFKFKNVTVRLGSANIFNSTEVRTGIDYLTHPEYRAEGTNHDIGILFLDKPVVFMDTVKKILLLHRPLKDNENLLVAGWGAWSEPVNVTDPLETNLQFLPHTYMPKDICERKIKDFNLDPGTICAGTPTPHKFVFKGDSGGPLVTLDGFQAGVVSYKLASNGITIFTYVPYYLSWIGDAQKQLAQKYCGRMFLRTTVEGGVTVRQGQLIKCED